MNDSEKRNMENLPKEESLNIKEYLFWAWDKKWWICGTVLLCLLIAAYYIYVTPKQYVRSASVMMKSDSKGQANINELAAFSDLAGFKSMSVDVLNEIEAFKSPILMQRVVERLHLDVDYYSDGAVRSDLLYGNAPVRVEFGDSVMPAGYSFKIKKVSDKEVELSSFRYKNDKIAFQPVKAALADMVKVPFGTLRVVPTLFFAEGFDDDIRVVCSPVDAKARSFMGKMTIALAQKQTSVINLSIKDVSIRRGDDVLNTLIDVYNEEWVNYMNESTVNTSRFINDRLVLIEQELGVVDSDVERFKRDNELFDITSEAQQTAQESSEYSSKYFEITNQLEIAKYIRDYLNDSAHSASLLPSNSGLSNSNVEAQISEYNKMMLRREVLVENSSENNPLVADYNNSLDMMRSSILRSLENLISTLSLQAKNIEDRENLIRDRMALTPGQAKELVNIERQQKVKESLYMYLLQKREENELSSALVVNNTRVLSYATGTPVPVAPKSMLIFLAAFVIGVALPFCYKIVKDLLDTTVRGKKDLETLSAPFVGEIPFVGVTRRFLCFTRYESAVSSGDIIRVQEGSKDMINEAFRVIRTNLDFMKKSTGSPIVTLVTSYNINSGKSFIVGNLAAIQAIRGSRVIAVDLDLRKRTLSHIVNVPKTGVSAYLGGYEDSLDNIVLKCPACEGLDVLPVGAIPPNPAELLQGARFDRMIDELKKRYDFIYLDCPPIDIVADTSVVAHVADQTLFVVRAGLMERALIGEVEKIYAEKRLPNMAVLLNGVRQVSSRYGYHRYGYHYGYGYGYGNNYYGK